MFRLNRTTTKFETPSKLESNVGVEVSNTMTVRTTRTPTRRRRRKFMLANTNGMMRSTWF